MATRTQTISTVGDYEWWRRRIAISGVLIFCALAVAYLIVLGRDTALHRDIANGLILLAGSTLGSYVFGAVWDDSSKRRAIVQSAELVAAAPDATTTATTTVTSTSIPPAGAAG